MPSARREVERLRRAKHAGGFALIALVGVRDSGPGLASVTLDRLFESFHTTKPGGLGLGPSICRSIIEAHGGRLWASANVPCGAIFPSAPFDPTPTWAASFAVLHNAPTLW
jgi:signal transduction histidine kinase